MKHARKTKRARKAKRPYKRLADRHARRATPNGAALHALALDNLVAAAGELRVALDVLFERKCTVEDIQRVAGRFDRALQIHQAAMQPA
jgi:hypothetical protein